MKQRVLQILKSPAAERIYFSFSATNERAVNVDGSTFRRVARLIQNGFIKVAPIERLPESEREFTSAAYLETPFLPFRSKTIFLPPVIGRVQEGFVIHEAVHASFHWTNSALRLLDEEIACYVSEALYYRHTGLDRQRYQATAWDKARVIADALIDGREPTILEIGNLRDAIFWAKKSINNSFDWNTCSRGQCW